MRRGARFVPPPPPAQAWRGQLSRAACAASRAPARRSGPPPQRRSDRTAHPSCWRSAPAARSGPAAARWRARGPWLRRRQGAPQPPTPTTRPTTRNTLTSPTSPRRTRRRRRTRQREKVGARTERANAPGRHCCWRPCAAAAGGGGSGRDAVAAEAAAAAAVADAVALQAGDRRARAGAVSSGTGTAIGGAAAVARSRCSRRREGVGATEGAGATAQRYGIRRRHHRCRCHCRHCRSPRRTATGAVPVQACQASAGTSAGGRSHGCQELRASPAAAAAAAAAAHAPRTAARFPRSRCARGSDAARSPRARWRPSPTFSFPREPRQHEIKPCFDQQFALLNFERSTAKMNREQRAWCRYGEIDGDLVNLTPKRATALGPVVFSIHLCIIKKLIGRCCAVDSAKW